jgi:predicted nuclease of predicted toxin-antitoxin system
MQWARKHNYVIFTHDLDFGTLLALTQATSPSVLQVRTQNVTPAHLQPLVVDALKQFKNLLEQGAIVIIDEKKVRARILPLLH